MEYALYVPMTWLGVVFAFIITGKGIGKIEPVEEV